jgi:hypothetical protein
VATWDEFATAAPDLAELGRERFERTEVLLLGTVRKDGTARISPCEFLFLDGQMMLGMMWQSKKALDLLRDARCVVHSTVSNKDGQEGEFKLRGRAVDVVDTDVRERNGKAAFEKTGWRPPEPYHLFSIEIEEAAFVRYSGEGHQTVITWREGGPVLERVRRWTGSGYET